MATITKNKIIFDSTDFLSGLHPQSTVGAPILFNGSDSMSNFNPMRQFGYASVGQNPTDVTNVSVIDGVQLNMANDEANQNGYSAGGTKLHKFALLTGALTNDVNFPHAVTGSTMSDVVKYRISGVDYIFYSWNDSTDGDVGRLTISGPTFDDDYMSTVPTGAAVLDKDFSHPLIVGDDDNLYIGDGSNLSRFDGTTFTPTALALPNDQVIRSFAKLNNRTLVIFTDTNPSSNTKLGECKAYFWDYIKQDPYRVYEIFGSEMGAGFSYKGSVGCFTRGISTDFTTNNRNVHYIIYDGRRFKKIRSIKDVNIPSVGGVDIVGDFLRVNLSGNVYSFGSTYEGVNAGLLQISSGSGSTSGMLRTTSGSKQLISSGTTTSGGLQSFVDNGTGNFETTFVEPAFNTRSRGKIKSVRTEFKNTFTGGRDFSLDLLDRQGNNVAQIYNGLTSIDSSRIVDDIYNNTSGNELGVFDALQLKLSWGTGSGASAAAIIRKVIVDFEEIKIN